MFWSNVTPRMPNSVIKTWPVGQKEMAYYYSIAEQVMNVTQEFAADSPITRVLLQRLQENGFPEAMNIPMAIDLMRTRFGEIHSNVFFSSIELLAAGLDRLPFDLAVKTRAVQVLTENERVTGIKVVTPEKKGYILRAKKVILAASTFKSPRILMNSGIRGEAIGRYLTMHVMMHAYLTMNRRMIPEPMGTIGILIPQTAERPYQIQSSGPGTVFWYQPYEERPFQEQINFDLTGFGELESRFDNKVCLDPYSKDECGMPNIRVHFSYSPRDKAVIRELATGFRQAAEAMKAELVSLDGRPAICENLPGSDLHASGTCRMGIDPATSATDSFGQIHGVFGLYIADKQCPAFYRSCQSDTVNRSSCDPHRRPYCGAIVSRLNENAAEATIIAFCGFACQRLSSSSQFLRINF